MNKLTSIVSDTWRGMLQRRLWPVAVLLLAALVAVPLLLTSEPEPVAPLPVSAADETAELAAQPLVAVASASERESARRVLGARKDPFKPINQPRRAKRADDTQSRATKSSGDAAKPSGATSAPGGAVSPGSGGAGYVAPAPLPTSPEPDATAKAPSLPAGSLTVRWGVAGDEELQKLEVERLDPLPTRDDPVMVYLGLTEDGRSAVFMLDAGIVVEGDGRCRPDPDDCQSIELAVGETEFIEVVGESGQKAQFQLDLVKIHGRRAAATSRLGKAPAVEARATRRALRSLGHPAPAYRFDARTGRLELVDAS